MERFGIDKAPAGEMSFKDMDDTEKGLTTGTISPPDLTAALKPKNRAIKDVKQARSIITTLELASRERNIKNARIMSKYNAERPYVQSALESEGLAWKHNFSTKPLPMLIDKVSPRFVKAIDGVKYLTNSALPDTEPGAAEKTEAFRREITSLARGRAGWTNLISELSQENALFGYTSLAWLDEFSWWPKHFRQDQFFVPTGTKQLAVEAQVIVLCETFLIHELFDLISDKEAAQTAGWNLPNTIARINAAAPDQRRSKGPGWERVYEDLARESGMGLSYEAGASVIKVYHMLATEYNGKVSHYIFSDEATPDEKSSEVKDTDTLFEREDQFDSMADAAAFFSFQSGNGKLHGSKGIGREIYDVAATVDRARNEVMDRLNLAGKFIIQGDDKALRRFKMSVVGNALLIGQGYTISERKLESGVEEFLQLDEFLTRLLDQMAGATTPKAFEGERVTKAAIDLFASREEETRDNIISRFLSQFATSMSTMQKRMCDPNTNEEDAKAMQKRLLRIMSREELNSLAKQPVAEAVKDYTNLERQQIAIIAQEAAGNPLYNQKEVQRRKLTAQINEEFADAVLLPDEDPTVLSEQTRLQQLELLILVGQGSPVNPSPRDNHMVHLDVLHPAMEAAATDAVTSGAQGLQVLHVLFDHANSHYQMAASQGGDPAKLQPVKEFLTKLDSAIKRMDAQEVEHQKNAEAAPIAIPPEMGGTGQPPVQPPPGPVPAGTPAPAA